jgi:hypothetical protein
LSGREGLGSSLPPAELARQDSGVFEEMKCLFSIASKDEKEVKSRKVSSLFSERQTLSSVASDAAAASGAKPSVALCWRVSTRRAGAAASDVDRQCLSCM